MWHLLKLDCLQYNIKKKKKLDIKVDATIATTSDLKCLH